MTILIVYQYFGTHKSAWSTRCYEFSRRWVAEGHNVIVLTSPYDKSDIKFSQNIEGIKVICSRWTQSNQDAFFTRILKFISFMCLSVWYALTLKFDLILCSSGPITVGVPGLFAKIFRRKKFVFEVRDLWPRGAIELGYINNTLIKKILYKFEGLCYKFSDLIVALSPDMMSDIKIRYPNKTIECIPNASDKLFANNSKIDKPIQFESPYFLYAGSLGIMDDCLQILEGVKVYNEQYGQEVNFYFIGKGILSDQMEAFILENRLTNVKLLGSMPKDQLVPYLTHAHACIVCFKNISVLQTSSPNKFFDALAASKPILQNTRGWIKTLMDKHPIGYSWEANNSIDFAKGVNALMKSDQYNSWCNNAAYCASNLFDRDLLSKQYLDLLKH